MTGIQRAVDCMPGQGKGARVARLAAETGVSATAIWVWLKKGGIYHTGMAVRVSELTGVPVADLVPAEGRGQ